MEDQNGSPLLRIQPSDQYILAARAFFRRSKSNPFNTGERLNYNTYIEFVNKRIFSRTSSAKVKKEIPSTDFTKLSLDAQLAAIREEERFMEIVTNKNVQIYAVRENPILVTYISDPHIDVLVEAAHAHYEAHDGHGGRYMTFLVNHILSRDSSENLRKRVPKINLGGMKDSLLDFYMKEFDHAIDFNNDTLIKW